MDFYNNGVTAVQTDTMFKEYRFMYAESQELDSQVLQMSYMGGNITFVVILPNQRNGLNALRETITDDNFERALNLMETINVKVYLPKFKVEQSYDLMKEINPKPIVLTESADYSRMFWEPTFVSKALHNVFIEVNEKGTEAAAVTAIETRLMGCGFLATEPTFRADHPFLYFIRDKTNSMILFVGQINKL